MEISNIGSWEFESGKVDSELSNHVGNVGTDHAACIRT